MRKTKGFSLIELMVAMAVLTILATVAVPKVQMWNARNRGLKAVLDIISDFSKARSIAGYTVVGDDTNGVIEIPVKVNDYTGVSEGDPMKVYLGIRLQTAIVFGAHEYSIYQKKDMANTTNSWQKSTLLKKNMLPDTVSIERVNGSAETGFNRRLVFTSNGIVKNNLDTFPDNTVSECGGTGNHHLKQIVMSAIVRSKIGSSGSDSIWYRIDIDKSGEYFICTNFSDKQSYEAGIFTNSAANPLNI